MTENGISLANLVLGILTLLGSWVVSALARKWTDREEVVILKEKVSALERDRDAANERFRDLERDLRERPTTPA